MGLNLRLLEGITGNRQINDKAKCMLWILAKVKDLVTIETAIIINILNAV